MKFWSKKRKKKEIRNKNNKITIPIGAVFNYKNLGEDDPIKIEKLSPESPDNPPY